MKLGDEYLWGRDLLVAPVTSKGATTRKLYLPEGDWYDFWTNQRYAGKRELKREVDLATLPLYARAGAILPLDPVRQYTTQPADEPTTIRIYPGRDGEFRWYQDDGRSLDYKQGKFTWTRLTWADKTRRLTIEPDGAAGFPPGARTFVVDLVTGGKRQTVRYAGTRVEAATRRGLGKFSAPVNISPVAGLGSPVEVAMDHMGDAVLAWFTQLPGPPSFRVRAALRPPPGPPPSQRDPALAPDARLRRDTGQLEHQVRRVQRGDALRV